jgi:anti-anti-sigma factor
VMAVTELRVATAIVGEECILMLTGDIDMSCSEEIGDLGVGTLESHRIRRLVVDLSEVTFMDSTGLNALVRMNRAASAQGKLLSLRYPPERVRKTLSITALDTVLRIEASGAPRLDASA